MVYLHRLVLPLLWLARLSNASSDATARDANYYAAHRTNPNVRHSHYYADSNNVLQSLSKFDKLYVTFSGCVWSTFEGDGDDSCGGDGGGDEYWYMGMTECFRANAAYSLYGVLKGQKDNGCTQGTFINSFFTTAGVEAFTQSMVATGKISFSGGSNDDQDGDYPGGITSVCQTEDDGRLLAEDGGNTHNTRVNSGAVSAGLTCNKKKFVKKSFNDPSCDPTSSQKILNTLTTFNAEINEAHCIPIYSSSDGYNEDQDQHDDGGSALSLLYNSQSCDIREYPYGCPDPFFTLKRYAIASEQAAEREYNSKRSNRIRGVSIMFLVLGGLFILCAILIYLRRSRLARLRAIKRKIKQKALGRKQGKGDNIEHEEDAPGRVSQMFGKK